MPRRVARTTTCRAANLSLPVDLLAQADATGLKIWQICERNPIDEIAKNHGEHWPEENRYALASLNDYVKQNSVALAGRWQF